MSKALGAGRPHVYVTRAATLEYMELLRHVEGFEAARRSLTVRAIGAEFEPGGGQRGHAPTYLFGFPGDPSRKLRIWVELDGALLVIVKLREATDLTGLDNGRYTSSPARYPMESRFANPK